MRFAIFDVETRIDKALVKAVLHRHEEIGEEEAYERTRAHLLARSRSGSDFFPLAFHVPVSVVIGDVNDERVLTGVQVLGADGYSEAGIVREFWERIERFRGTLVTFNGRNFDLPVMELAALRHGCVMPRYFKGGFRYRYSDEAHYDLYEFVTNFGAYSVRGGFHLLAQLVGLPGKGAVDGAGVQALWESGRLADIHAYCRRDVIQTYFLFLRLELMRGRITAEQHAAASPHRRRSPLQPVLLDLPIQPLPVDPEQPRGLVLVAPALAQRGGEQATLGLLERRHVARIDGGRVGGREPAHGGGQVVQRDRVGDREREGALDRVLQLAHVAGPAVDAQALHRLGGEALRRHLVLAAEALEEVLDQQRDVLRPGAQRRQREVHHVEAVVEVLPEAAGPHLALEVAVAGGDEAHVDRHREARAEGRHLALLDGAQELRLQGERDLRHLVEEEGAALGGAEDAVVVVHGAGERPAPVAEELAVEQRLGEPRAVDGDEGMGGECAPLVDGARDQLLSRAALAAHQDRALVPGDGVDDAVGLLHRRALADQLAEAVQPPDLPAEPRVLALERVELQDPLDGEQDLLRPRVLDQVVRRTELHGLDRALDRAVAGEHDHRGREAALVHGAQKGHAVHHRHLQVGQDDVEARLAEAGERRLAVRRVLHGVARALEVLGERARHVDLVLDEEDAGLHRGSALGRIGEHLGVALAGEVDGEGRAHTDRARHADLALVV